MKSAKENLIKVLTGKKMLFLENDNGLSNDAGRLANFMDNSGLHYNTLFDLRNIPFYDIIAQIESADGIIFQTQWVYSISTQIKKFMFALQTPKIVIECCLADPSWYYIPKNIVHYLYILKAYEPWEEEGGREWEFYKITNKPYWDYKNKFNK